MPFVFADSKMEYLLTKFSRTPSKRKSLRPFADLALNLSFTDNLSVKANSRWVFLAFIGLPHWHSEDFCGFAYILRFTIPAAQTVGVCLLATVERGFN